MLEQGLFSIAAGISMLFATFLIFASQTLYGPWSLPVFMALVIGYMFKDRIKDILRMYFSKKMMHVLFDRKTSIYVGSSEQIGSCIESVDFIDEDKAPDHILKIRNRDHITEIESDWVTENLLRYRKRIKLTNQNVLKTYIDIDTKGVNDIMRFNISDFVRRMGNPKKELYVLTQDEFEKVKAERVYHITMILHYRNSEFSHLKRLRIVLNRRRIKRIETVYSEEG